MLQHSCVSILSGSAKKNVAVFNWWTTLKCKQQRKILTIKTFVGHNAIVAQFFSS